MTWLRRTLPLAIAVCTMAALPGSVALPFGTWTRLSLTPIIAPRGDGFEAAGTFNPTVVRHGGQFVMLYRAQDRTGKSSLGYATSRDGVRFTRRATPVMVAEAPYEEGGGVEDPRLAKFGDTYYLTYTGYNNVSGVGPNKQDAQLCLATSKDLIHWTRHGVIFPAYKGKWNTHWTKSGAIVPRKINGKYWMYFMGDPADLRNQMGVASSDDLIHWTEALDQPVMRSRPGTFDSRVVEPGPSPLVTPEGILLLYNGADDRLAYRVGWVLFDRNDPTRIIARSDTPIFEPEREWESGGQVPNVVFLEGLVRDGNRWLFYYGGGDKHIGVATAPVR